MKYEIRTESAGLSINLRTGLSDAKQATRVKFRKKGSKGRFESFVVVGAMPDVDLADLVAAYLAKKVAP